MASRHSSVPVYAMVLTHLEPPRLAELRSDFFYLAGPVWNVEGTDQRRRGDRDLARTGTGVRVTNDLHRVPHVNLRHLCRRRQYADATLRRTRHARHAVTHPNRAERLSEVIEQAESPLLELANRPA